VSGYRFHHVGHVVRDIDVALAAYRRMGFAVPPPVFPALGDPPRPVGAGNTHIRLRDNFVELVTVQAGTGARFVRLDAADPAGLRADAERTAQRAVHALARAEGLHILAFQTPDADADARRLAGLGVPHSAVHRLCTPQRSIAYLEVDDGGSPEARLALAEPQPAPAAAHPNGAQRLVDVIICVADADLDAVTARYETYLDQAAVTVGPARRILLGDGALRIAAVSALAAVLPGVAPPVLPGIALYAVTVADLAATGALLAANGLTARPTPAGGLRVTLLGANVVFIPADQYQ
jgi:Glyoxalase-like domain